MSTGSKERQVITRAARVLDEIESRIHELREELEQQGMATPRGRKAKHDEGHDEAETNGHEPQAQGRAKPAEADKRTKGAKAEHDDAGEHTDDDREPHGQGRVKHPETDKRLKGHKGEHEEGGADHAAATATADDEHEPHAQGRVKHPESDKRLKANKD